MLSILRPITHIHSQRSIQEVNESIQKRSPDNNNVEVQTARPGSPSLFRRLRFPSSLCPQKMPRSLHNIHFTTLGFSEWRSPATSVRRIVDSWTGTAWTLSVEDTNRIPLLSRLPKSVFLIDEFWFGAFFSLLPNICVRGWEPITSRIVEVFKMLLDLHVFTAPQEGECLVADSNHHNRRSILFCWFVKTS